LNSVAKIVVQHDEDPSIGIVLEVVPEGTPGRAHGCYGKCTECGWPMHRWNQADAIKSAENHVDRHESSL
jgi:hypothetical protein